MWFLLGLGADLDPEPAWHRLHPTEAAATSYLRSAYNQHDENYHPRYVLDDDVATAWNEGVDGLGEGEALTLSLTPTRSEAVRLRIRNGYQKSATLLAANAAPALVRILLIDDTGQGSTTQLVELTRTSGWQEVRIDPATPLTLAAIRLEVVSTHAGKTYPDTCISDVQVWSDGVVDEAAQAENLSATLTWIAARQQTAEDTAFTQPFASAHFTVVSERELPGKNTPVGLNEMRRLMEEARTEGALTRGEPVNPVRPIVLHSPYNHALVGLEWLLAPENLHLSATDQAWRLSEGVADTRVNFTDPQISYITTSNLHVLRTEEGTLRAVYGVHSFVGQTGSSSAMRMFYSSRHQYVARYGDRQLMGLLVEIVDDDEEGGFPYLCLFSFERDHAGQVNAIEQSCEDGASHWSATRYQAG